MTAAQRYELARGTAAGALGSCLTFQAIWKHLHSEKAGNGYSVRAATKEGYFLLCLVSLDEMEPGKHEEHVSISRSDGRVPTWSDLVLVRALAWPDEALVVQHLPRGDEAWVSVNGVEVLHLWRQG